MRPNLGALFLGAMEKIRALNALALGKETPPPAPSIFDLLDPTYTPCLFKECKIPITDPDLQQSIIGDAQSLLRANDQVQLDRQISRLAGNLQNGHIPSAAKSAFIVLTHLLSTTSRDPASPSISQRELTAPIQIHSRHDIMEYLANFAGITLKPADASATGTASEMAVPNEMSQKAMQLTCLKFLLCLSEQEEYANGAEINSNLRLIAVDLLKRINSTDPAAKNTIVASLQDRIDAALKDWDERNRFIPQQKPPSPQYGQ